MKDIIWTDYMKYRSSLRRIDLMEIEEILRHTTERYIDSETNRIIAVGRQGTVMVTIPYEEAETSITPITVHATTRQQINFRIRTGRYSHG